MRSEFTRMRFILTDHLVFMGLAVLFLAGCASTPERNPLPLELTSQASIPGIPQARFWGDEWPKWSINKLETLTDADMQREYLGIYDVPHSYLAISGGGANGAFGAGLLSGWSDSGKRPEFTMVTGISTGALTAPFAFLGPDYDDELKAVYTATSTKDIIEERSFLAAAFSDSMADTKPLRALLERHITAGMIEAIGQEHMRGRRLFIGTVNLDAGRSVIWNIGAIALSKHPRGI